MSMLVGNCSRETNCPNLAQSSFLFIKMITQGACTLYKNRDDIIETLTLNLQWPLSNLHIQKLWFKISKVCCPVNYFGFHKAILLWLLLVLILWWINIFWKHNTNLVLVLKSWSYFYYAFLLRGILSCNCISVQVDCLSLLFVFTVLHDTETFMIYSIHITSNFWMLKSLSILFFRCLVHTIHVFHDNYLHWEQYFHINVILY